MLHYANLETERVREEEEQRLTSEDAFRGLQCGDSLAIAAKHVGEDVFGTKKLLRRTLRILGHSR